MAHDSIRSFLAIELSQALKDEASSFVEHFQKDNSGFRFIPSQNWHLTLRFLGQVKTDKLEVLQNRLPEALKGIQPFLISLEGFGTFGSGKAPRILWIGIGGDLAELSTLKMKLDQMLQKMHFKIEKRSYHPHITVARAKEGISNQPLLPVAVFKSQVTDRIDNVTLFRSDLLPGGAQHCPLKRFPLQRNS